ncbi:MAG: hypothetical protein KDD45_02995 [Bdellovibrionales bacterium]|nr:hypothetical protein [Bdellovibrionales bacterium]
MVSKPIIVTLVIKLIIIFSYTLDVQILFTSNLSLIIINMQAILNSLAYVDMITVSFENIGKYLQQEEADLSHVNNILDTSSNIAISVKGGSFYWEIAEKKKAPIKEEAGENGNGENEANEGANESNKKEYGRMVEEKDPEP